jgi:hypothetical protein
MARTVGIYHRFGAGIASTSFWQGCLSQGFIKKITQGAKALPSVVSGQLSFELDLTGRKSMKLKKQPTTDNGQRTKFQKASDRNGLNLEAYIKVDKERITGKRVLFHGIRFHLDKDILKSIQHAQETGRRLYISRELLADLRYYALIDGENRLQSGLTFCTYYLRRGSQEALMRSVISTDGDILHQIKSECLERPNFCRKIASAHYWLIDQLLGQLRLRAILRLNQLSWGLSLLIVATTAIAHIKQLMQVNPWTLLAPVVMAWLLQIGLQRLMRLFLPTVGRWALRRLLSGLLSRQPLEKNIAKGILAWLVP